MCPSDSQPTPVTSEGSERRVHARARAEWPVMIELADGPHQARIRDVSRGGICFFLDRPVDEMTLLRVEFDLPEAVRRAADGSKETDSRHRRLCGQGAVVRCERISAVLEHYEIAVFLTEMSDADRETIAQYVAAKEA